LKLPAVVGEPEIAPEPDTFKPGGTLPDTTDQVYGGVPPDALSCCETCEETVAESREPVVIVSAGMTLMLHAFVAEPDTASETAIVNAEAPGCAGVPLMVPDFGSICNPDGREPFTDHVYGAVPPDAETDELYAWPTTAPAAGHDAIATEDDTWIDRLCVAAFPALSATRTVNVNTPAPDGVPFIWPPPPIVIPEGSAPDETLHVYGCCPPEAVSVCAYAWPCTASLRAVVITESAALMVMEQLCVAAEPPLSATLMVKLEFPAELGVPLIWPCCESRLSPAGNWPAEMLQLYGCVPPEVLSVAEYACPTVPVEAGHAGIATPKLIVIEKFAVAVAEA